MAAAPSPGDWTPCSLWGCTVLTDCISQTMGKLGASLSSGHVLVNGTRKQVLLVGAPTRGRSHTMKLGWVLVGGSLTTSNAGKVVKSGASQT